MKRSNFLTLETYIYSNNLIFFFNVVMSLQGFSASIRNITGIFWACLLSEANLASRFHFEGCH